MYIYKHGPGALHGCEKVNEILKCLFDKIGNFLKFYQKLQLFFLDKIVYILSYIHIKISIFSLIIFTYLDLNSRL